MSESPHSPGGAAESAPPASSQGVQEVFRDEDVAYATSIWSAGGQAELHVWPGGFHGFDVFAPDSRVSSQAAATRNNWIA